MMSKNIKDSSDTKVDHYDEIIARITITIMTTPV